MKRSRLLALISCLLLSAASAAVVPLVSAMEKAPAKHGSIRPVGEVKKPDLPALAKITFEEALKAALAAVPGKVVVAELEIEHGDLMYSFEIVTADKSIKEVEIDAGDGTVLEIEEE